MIYFVFAVIGALASGFIAMSKDRNALGWAAFGFLLPIIGIIVVACIPAAGSNDGTVPTSPTPSSHG